MNLWMTSQAAYVLEHNKELITQSPYDSCWDHEFDVINRINRIHQRETTTKILDILVTNGHEPESVFDVKFEEYER